MLQEAGHNDMSPIKITLYKYSFDSECYDTLCHDVIDITWIVDRDVLKFFVISYHRYYIVIVYYSGLSEIDIQST